MEESIRTRAWASALEFARSGYGRAVLGAVGALTAALSALLDSSWPPSERVVTAILAAAIGAPVGLFVLSLIVGPLAPKWQRDEARTRLRAIREAADAFKLSPVEGGFSEGFADTPIGADPYLYVGIKNEGRRAIWAALIETIDTSPPLGHQWAPLYWVGYTDALTQDLATGEERRIGIGLIHLVRDLKNEVSACQFQLSSLSGATFGENLVIGRYNLNPGTTTAVIRITTRDRRGASYARRIALTIAWDGPGHEPTAALGPDPNPPEKTTEAYADLLDF